MSAKRVLKLIIAFSFAVAVYVICGLTVGAKEVTGEYSFSYFKDGQEYPCSNVADTPFNGIRIQCTGKQYYLQYKTSNGSGQDYYSPVKSNNAAAAEYAGLKSGKQVYRLSIDVYSNSGELINDKVVVMYRTKTADNGWLNWVSNIPYEKREAIRAKYGLDGGVDKDSYAGYRSKPATGFEIRIFEESEEQESSKVLEGLGGIEVHPAMYYSVNSLNKQPFTGSADNTGIDCLWINTDPQKPYYLKYKVDSLSGSYSYVYSNNHADSVYAGLQGNRITKLYISAFTLSEERITGGVVVMYRVKAGGRWLDWVSNADPEWMTAVQAKYNITGPLDTTSNYAGLSASTPIEGVEIRVFEENTAEITLPETGEKTLDAGHIYQNNGYPTGCESVSTVTALEYLGVNITVDEFIDNFLDKTEETVFDPNTAFGGDPRSENGIGCYAPVIERALGKALYAKCTELKATAVYGKTVEQLCRDYIDNGLPVIFWATNGMAYPATKMIRGGVMPWVSPEHCLLLVGYDNNNYYFSDPLKTDSRTAYPKRDVITAYLGMGAQAVVIEKDTDAGYLKGDLTGDGSVDLLDFIRLKKVLAGIETVQKRFNADIDGDGGIDVTDLAAFRKKLIS